MYNHYNLYAIFRAPTPFFVHSLKSKAYIGHPAKFAACAADPRADQ